MLKEHEELLKQVKKWLEEPSRQEMLAQISKELKASNKERKTKKNI